MSVGNYLREARESAGYSVEKIASLTRIPQTVIRDLEEEKFSSSGGTTYARGHIRTIAKLLNADTDRLISSFEEITGESNRPMIELLEENNATALRRKQSLNISPKLIATAASVIVGVAIIIPTGMALSKSLTHKSSVSTVATKSQSHSSSPQKTTTNATPSTPSGTVTTGRGVVVTASAGTSWLSVNDSQGTKIFSGKISNGQSQTFDPSNGLFMTIGNAGAVSVSVNGKSQGLLGAVGEVKTLSFEPPASNG
jgi:cytoskeletal protein RodZ